MASKVLLAALLCVMVSLGASQSTGRGAMRGLLRARECRIDQLSESQPSDRLRLESEGGQIELWDEEEEQFQCAGVAAMKVTVQPNSLSLPSYQSSPRLVYVEQGEGVVGISLPGCPETYHSRGMEMRGERGMRGEERGEHMRDMHQQTRRIRKGDIVAIPAGTVHWCFNDGEEDLVVVAVHNLNAEVNQLDQSLRSFYLAGGLPGRSRGERGERGIRGSQMSFQNILKAFDPELLAEALGTDERVVRQIQESEERGLIVRAREMHQMVVPPRIESEREGERYEEEREEGRRPEFGCRKRGGCGSRDLATVDENGIDEAFCTMKIIHSINTRREADVFSSEAGRINILNENKLPILSLLDMSAEKGNLFPNAIFAPHWSINGHSVLYVARGEANVQVVDDNGERVYENHVSEGDMLVIPQFFVSTFRAGRDGFEYVSFKTTSSPMMSPLNGYASVFRGMPVPVISNAYEISLTDAFQLKQRRGREHALFSPFRGRS